MSWLHYLIEANIYLGVFYLCYRLLLDNNTHYTLGRVYLISACILAFIIPLTQVSALKSAPAQSIQTVSVRTSYVPFTNIEQHTAKTAPSIQITLNDILAYIYAAGVLVAFIVFVIRLWRLYNLTKAGKSQETSEYQLVKLTESHTAFSFFNYLYIGTDLQQPHTIIAHEMVHIRQKHSVDILFLEILKVVNWFSPIVYMFQQSLKTVHEYIADEQTAALENDTLAYSSFLLSSAYGLPGASVTHSFFNNNLLKRRIIMLNQKRSGKLARLKYLAAVPLCVGMLGASTLVFSKDYGLIDLSPRKAMPVAAKADSAKYTLKLTDIAANISGISDKVVVDKEDGFKREYTVATLTKEQQTEAKQHGYLIEIVPRESLKADTTFATKPPAIIKNGNIIQERGYLIDDKTEYFTVTVTDNNGNEKTYNSTDATDAERKMLAEKYGYKFFNYDMKGYLKKVNAPASVQQKQRNLPPPPPPPTVVKSPFETFVDYLSATVKYPAEAVKSKRSGGTLLNFHVDEGGNVTNANVMGKAGLGLNEALLQSVKSFKGKIKSPAGDYKLGINFMMLGDNNVKFPPPVATKDENYIGVINIVGMTDAQQKGLKNIPPPPPPVVKKNAAVAPPTAAQISKRPPPPPPFDAAYKDLITYLKKHTRYPTVAFQNKVNGHVLLSLDINKDHKVTGVKVDKGFDPACDAEAARALSTYSQTINKAPGTYKLAVTFMLTNSDESQYYAPKPLTNDVINQKNFIGQATLIFSTN
ncbi:M56 family metallopeptidase [Mucilaginibacter litoreus]|uniref:M56 family metallopeptidase n=1 Tax=Mucilaginibacter litoreus TaxID=1048221 RepID=A0ABW3AND6_9SPHI